MADSPASSIAVPSLRPPRAVGKFIVRCLAVLVSLVGVWVCIDLLRMTGGGSATNPLLAAYCGGDEQTGQLSDCMSVLKSERAYVGRGPDAAGQERQGVPWAAVGLAYFGFVGIWYLFVGCPTRSRGFWHLIVLAVVVWGIIVSLWLTNVMYSELRRWCIGCLSAHALNAALLILTLAAAPWRRDPPGVVPRPGASLALATLCAGYFFGLLTVQVASAMMARASYSQLEAAYTRIVDDPKYINWKLAQAGKFEFSYRDDEAFVGDSAAPNTLTVFMDYQCRACQRLMLVLNAVEKKYHGKVRITFRNFPLDASCNKRRESTAHPNACIAARAAEAARLVGGAEAFRQMHELLYARAKDLDLNLYVDWAEELGLDRTAFTMAMESPAVEQRIREDIDLGSQIGVTATPTIFFNGRMFETWNKLSSWDELLRDKTPTTGEAADKSDAASEPAAQTRAAASQPATQQRAPASRPRNRPARTP